MQGRPRTARATAEQLDPGTYQMVLDRAYVTQGKPKAEHLKKGKTMEESAYAQVTLVWKEPESGIEVRDNFLKLPEYLEFSEDSRYKSKFQKRLENMLNKQLDDNAGQKVALNFDFIENWEELTDAIAEEENGKPAQVQIKEFKWDGHLMFGHEWLVTVVTSDSGYTNVSTVAPLPKRRTAQPAPATQAAAPAQKAPPARPERPAPAPAAEPGEVDLPF